MGWLHNLFTSVAGWFTTPKAVAVEQTIAGLLPFAVTIVNDINAIAPNRTLAQINTIATKYALPAVTAIANNPAGTGNTLLNLATDILQKNHAPDASIALLNTTVQLAVMAAQTKA